MESFKQHITEAKKLKAEDYEAAIVMGWYALHNRELDNKSGISKDTIDVLVNNPQALESGRRIAEHIKKSFPALENSQAEQYGRATTSLTKFWKNHGASNTTPKTDIMIGKMRFSLKIGAAQLMSGGKEESMATFYAALKNVNNQLINDPQVQKVNSILESFVKNSLAPGRLRGIIKSGKNELVNAGERAHKECMVELGKLFQSNQSFKIAFAREAMSGFEKYGEKSPAAAEYMLVATHDGNKVSIHSVYDDSYCEKIADRMKLQARFKTSSRKIKGEKTGEYNFWSVVSLIVNAMDENVTDLGNGEYLVEFKLLGKAKSIFQRYWTKIYSFITKNILRLLKFLGFGVDISLKGEVNFD